MGASGDAEGAQAAATAVAAKSSSAQEPSPETAFVPTRAWLMKWKKKLMMQPIQCLIDDLGPKVEALCKQDDVADQEKVFRYLKQSTMVGVLPVPHPIVIRTYQ